MAGFLCFWFFVSGQTNSKWMRSETQSRSRALLSLRMILAMDRQLMEWKLGVEALWSAATLDYREAERLAADIATASTDPTLRPAAAQALPSLRNAAPRKRRSQHPG